MSLIEAATNVIVGYALAVGMQIAVFPVFGIHVALADQLAIGLAFTGLSLVRGATSGRLTTSTKTPNVSNVGRSGHCADHRLVRPTNTNHIHTADAMTTKRNQPNTLSPRRF